MVLHLEKANQLVHGVLSLSGLSIHHQRRPKSLLPDRVQNKTRSVVVEKEQLALMPGHQLSIIWKQPNGVAFRRCSRLWKALTRSDYVPPELKGRLFA